MEAQPVRIPVGNLVQVRTASPAWSELRRAHALPIRCTSRHREPCRVEPDLGHQMVATITSNGTFAVPVTYAAVDPPIGMMRPRCALRPAHHDLKKSPADDRAEAADRGRSAVGSAVSVGESPAVEQPSSVSMSPCGRATPSRKGSSTDPSACAPLCETASSGVSTGNPTPLLCVWYLMKLGLG